MKPTPNWHSRFPFRVILQEMCATPHADRQLELGQRVVRAAEAALARQQYVSAIDVFCGMGLLQPANVDSWRKGRIDFLEQMIQGKPDKIFSSMAILPRLRISKMNCFVFLPIHHPGEILLAS